MLWDTWTYILWDQMYTISDYPGKVLGIMKGVNRVIISGISGFSSHSLLSLNMSGFDVLPFLLHFTVYVNAFDTCLYYSLV